MRHHATVITSLLLFAVIAPLSAQQNPASDGARTPATASDSTKPAEKTPPTAVSSLRPIEIQHFRPADQRGIDVFEPPKEDTIPFTGFKLAFGAAFTQQFQGLRHSNTANANLVNGVDANKLITIGHGFNNAVANLNVHAQIANGIRVSLTSYLSARHHQETWVKDGFILIDGSPIDKPVLNDIMKVLTLRIGHFEVNYGDAHFRRSDNGNAMYNAFIGNFITDAFTTEIGAEAYARTGPWLAMVGATGGEVRGQVTVPTSRAPSYLAKLGFDKKVTSDLRLRLTGSLYTTKKSANNTLFSGDRAGSRYYDVLENTASTETAQAWSGEVRPGMSSKITSMVANPFVRFHGLELFGNIERAKGRTATETVERTWNQYVAETVYRFANDNLFVGARYNKSTGQLANITNDVGADRRQLSGGWFLTPVMLLKGEYVNQRYFDFPVTDIRNGGKFKGFMVEAAVAF
jgi:hypothetical protein